MRLSRRILFPLGAAALLGFCGAAAAKTVTLSGTFAGEHGTPQHPTGTVDATLDTDTHRLDYTIDYSGLSGPVTVAHFHGPAGAGTEAGALQPIDGPYASGMHRTVTVDAATQAAMLKGMSYVNLHTKAFPKGEARAQLTVAEPAAADAGGM
ncbi:CHRD domain-containing protein [Dyella sp.]|jgi:hypothetical protein|uniref:CHRD domain-containing protein n=1 Tax=Dyella sp. TaxID=1869338 RepID=UPI002D79167F|nr:CHRD domain-containing protein [Dyella sp.]HET6432913.1 CHRD domain-containing protein [Dyella sp.]